MPAPASSSSASTQDASPTATSVERERALLRHLLATLAYRASKVLREVSVTFPEHRVSPTSRNAAQIVAHMGDLLDWGLGLANGTYSWRAAGTQGWEADVARFFTALEALDARFAAPEPLGYPAETIIQGPLADALTHVGQLALMRGSVGVPVRPESYARAEIVVGRVQLEQAPPGREFDGDASFPAPR